MPDQRSPYLPLPPDTARAARSVFNIENLYLTVGDQLGDLFGDLDYNDLNSYGATPVSVLFILAMVTIFQFAEDLPDSQAADAVRTRMDWKYALHLPVHYPGFAPSELGEFRQRLQRNPIAQGVFRQMLTRLAQLGLVSSKDKRQADVTQVLMALEALNRTTKVMEGMSVALEALASREAEWLRVISLPHWYERYGQWHASPQLPGPEHGQEAQARVIGADISYLLQAITDSDTTYLALVPEVQALRRLWQQEFSSGDPGSTEDPFGR
jgi:transposase